MTTTVKAMRAAVNRGKLQPLGGRANSLACAVYSDALRDDGRDAEADVWTAVAEFLPVWAEHRRVIWGHTDTETLATDRNKMIALDYSAPGSFSGCFLVEKATGYVYSIKAYGKKNRLIAVTLAELARIYRDNLTAARVRGEHPDYPRA